ncbi:MAG: NAD(P)/FAD-dependent oxidoreductase [Spirochaetales bacterium]|nr:NAD(P)/FAD-dependent oxidoreductase [Spirochaetales bacterium]
MQTKKVLVVGGGMAGLVSAASMARQGLDVTLIEKNEKCGGLVNSFTREGFLFDGGTRAIENAGMILPMLRELDIDLEMLRSRISLGIEKDIIHVETDDSLLDYEQQLKRMYPDSQEDVDRVIAVIQDMKRHMNVLFGSGSPFFKDPKRDRWYFITGLIPWLFRLIGTILAIIRMQVPVEDFLEKTIKNRSLNDIISQHFFTKTPAFFAMSYFALYIDYYYPKGGVGQLSAKIAEAILDAGGKVLTNTDICAVDIAGKTLTDQHDVTYAYDRLVWAADLKQLYRIADYTATPPGTQKRIAQEKSRILASRGAESVFTVFIAVDQDPQVFRNISYGHFFYTPSREGLQDIQKGELDKILRNWDKVSKTEILDWTDRFCRFNTFELSIPALNDPATAPPGKTGIIASFLMNHALVKHVYESGWYEEYMEYLRKKVIEILDSTIYPGLKGHGIFSFTASPLTIENRVRSSEGAIVGWSFDQTIPVEGGMVNMKKAVKTAFPQVYKAGQWAGSPAGLPTCILTAKLVADMVRKELA